MERPLSAPWKVVPQLSASENHRGYRVADSDGYYFADVWPLDPDGIEGGKRARLIAAAPEMLKALEFIAKATQDIDTLPMASTELIHKTAIAAIAKAKGETK